MGEDSLNDLGDSPSVHVAGHRYAQKLQDSRSHVYDRERAQLLATELRAIGE